MSDEAASYSLNGLHGTMTKDAQFTASTSAVLQAGTVTAQLGDLASTARIRIVPPLPYREDFESLAPGAVPPGWITSPLKCQVMELDGQRVLRKLAERPSPAFARLRCYMLPPIPARYSVKADILGRAKKNRFFPDMGLINCRYLMYLTGTSERMRMLRLVSWAPIPRIQKDVSFPWSVDTWYSMKVSVDTEHGQTIVRGKVWPRDDDEPAEWTTEMIDPSPNVAGSPGLYAYSVSITEKSPGTEVLFDNVEVTDND